MTKGGVKGDQGFQRGGRVKDFKGGSMPSRGVQGVKDPKIWVDVDGSMSMPISHCHQS